jgi:hypothetical protein
MKAQIKEIFLQEKMEALECQGWRIPMVVVYLPT